MGSELSINTLVASGSESKDSAEKSAYGDRVGGVMKNRGDELLGGPLDSGELSGEISKEEKQSEGLQVGDRSDLLPPPKKGP